LSSKFSALLVRILDNSKADCHRLLAEPIFTSLSKSDADFGSKVKNFTIIMNDVPITATTKGIRKKE
jgi:hypothetical protein